MARNGLSKTYSSDSFLLGTVKVKRKSNMYNIRFAILQRDDNFFLFLIHNSLSFANFNNLRIHRYIFPVENIETLYCSVVIFDKTVYTDVKIVEISIFILY